MEGSIILDKGSGAIYHSTITCRSVGVYTHALTRGHRYIVNNEDMDKYRITGDHGRLVWISKAYFIKGDVDLPFLQSWTFDDEPTVFDLVEITLTFSDGSRRWSLITTPDKLANYFEHQKDSFGFHATHLIIARTMNFKDIDTKLKQLEAVDELNEASKILK